MWKSQNKLWCIFVPLIDMFVINIYLLTFNRPKSKVNNVFIHDNNNILGKDAYHLCEYLVCTERDANRIKIQFLVWTLCEKKNVINIHKLPAIYTKQTIIIRILLVFYSLLTFVLQKNEWGVPFCVIFHTESRRRRKWFFCVSHVSSRRKCTKI